MVGVAIVDKAVHARAIDVESYRDAEIVDSEEFSFGRAGRIDIREVAVVVEEAVNVARGVRVEAGNPAQVIDRRRDGADRVRKDDVRGECSGVDVVSVAVAMAVRVV